MQFIVLVYGTTYIGSWSDCSKVDVKYMEQLANSLNNYYGNDWQIEYRRK